MHKSLPDVDRRLADSRHGVLADNVEGGKDTVATLRAKSLEKSLAGLVGTAAGSLVLLELDLAADTSDTVQELAGKRDRGLTDTPARVDHTLLELGKEEVDSLGRVVGNDHLTRTHRRLADVLRVVRKTVEDRRDNAREVGREAVAEGSGQVDEQRDEALTNVGAGAGSVGDDLGEKSLETLHTKTRQDLGETLGGTLAVDTRSVGTECLEKLLNKVGEVDLSETLDKSTERLGGSGTRLGDGVDEDLVDERHELVEVRDEVADLGK